MSKGAYKTAKLCISVSGRNVRELANRVGVARKYDPYLIELRLDCLDPVDGKSLLAIHRLLRGREIITLRRRSEGGKFKGTERERIILIKKIVSELEPKFIDIEIITLKRNISLLTSLEENHVDLIASFHDLTGKKSKRELESIIQSVPRTSSLFATKIVSEARTFEDNTKVLSLYTSKQNRNKRLIAFCTGPLGILSRISCLSLGSPYTYTSLPGQAVASGQLDVQTMRSITKLLRV